MTQTYRTPIYIETRNIVYSAFQISKSKFSYFMSTIINISHGIYVKFIILKMTHFDGIEIRSEEKAKKACARYKSQSHN